ncbi:Fatty acid amide hydrolase [Thelohanellus kitauei]|uniref:Fatty acid amide hydrolase n=1 Tax=Thelohanellus kitauei TaxID=669202 RepID=A0A0C2MVQ4_THEKT|nr:Fatty acid amide hydrolase [Thelohanellus kitauei]KII65707.1 Fatty acid amide hydrolase [Thelohanellus kitauei]
MISLGSTITEAELGNVKKQRNRAMKIMDNIFKEVDIFLLLTTSRYPEKMDVSHRKWGYLNPWTFIHHTHHSGLSSVSGIPSLAINIGFDKSSNLPIALQMMSKWWSEDLLLSVAYQIEKMFPLTSTPNHYQRVLDIQKSDE